MSCLFEKAIEFDELAYECVAVGVLEIFNTIEAGIVKILMSDSCID